MSKKSDKIIFTISQWLNIVDWILTIYGDSFFPPQVNADRLSKNGFQCSTVFMLQRQMMPWNSTMVKAMFDKIIKRTGFDNHTLKCYRKDSSADSGFVIVIYLIFMVCHLTHLPRVNRKTGYKDTKKSCLLKFIFVFWCLGGKNVLPLNAQK